MILQLPSETFGVFGADHCEIQLLFRVLHSGQAVQINMMRLADDCHGVKLGTGCGGAC